MGLKCVSISILIVAVVTYFVYRSLFASKPVPKFDVNKYWGPSALKNRKDSSEVKPFKIQYSAEVIAKLKNKLSEPLDLVEPLEGVGFRYGFNKHKLIELVKFWRDDYLPRWNERQQFLNGLPQYETQIQGLKIHFIHTKETTDKAKNVIPLLLLHGWPGSVREFYELIPKLTKANDDTAFVVVAPSLPGYGWSKGASVTGLGPAEVAVVLRNLMIKLGYKSFLIQGGDWGSVIGSAIATLFPQNVIAFHSNFCSTLGPASSLKAFFASFYPSWFMPEKYTHLIYPMGEKFANILEETGNMHIQATKPDTIGTVLSNNPVGLAAYILEKFSTWTNPKYRDTNDGGLDNDYSKDALFDNLMIYYLTNSITTSHRLYAEFYNKRYMGLQINRVPTPVPTGCARFKNDLLHEFDWQLSSKYPNLVHSTWYDDGGHFIAMQLPDVLYDDFIHFVKKLNWSSFIFVFRCEKVTTLRFASFATIGLKCVSISILIVAVVSYFVYQSLFAPIPVPKFDVNKYWGPSALKNRKDSSEVKPFKIQYSADVIAKLKNKLSEPLDLVEPLEGVGFRYGFNKHKLTELIKFWRDDYLPRWNERQRFLNELPQFETQIQGLKIHFIHTKETTAKAKNVIPLLLLHGWPGSVREFYELIPKLTKANDDTAFVVVAPSLPGYGWSEGARVTGLGPTEVAVVLRNLMIKLGYKSFLIQGGDWGSIIGSTIATLFPENVIAYHSNLCATLDPASSLKAVIASFYPSLFMPEKYTHLIYPMGEKFTDALEESGYMHIQASKPDTIGTALSNNPVGLAAYILEKFSTWTNPKYRDTNDGGLDNDYSKDALFDNLMIYYLTNSITTSQRLYAEGFNKRSLGLQIYRVPTPVPTGCARFKNDLLHEFDWQLSSKYPNLVHSTWYDDGGHFIAMQLPDVLYDDFTHFVKKLNLTS